MAICPRGRIRTWGKAMELTTSATHALAATTITVAGITTGLSYEVLLAGFAGALASLSYLEEMTVWRRLWTLLSSTLTAGYTAHLAEGAIRYFIEDLQPSTATLVGAGFLIGLSAQALIPGILQLARRKAQEI